MYKIVKQSAHADLQSLVNAARKDYRVNRDPDSPKINAIEAKINQLDPAILNRATDVHHSASSGRYFIQL